jgi:hypothetical protein
VFVAVTGGPWLDVALVASLRADRVGDQLRTRVVEQELRRRLGEISCRWATTEADVPGAGWAVSTTLPSRPRPDVLVVFGPSEPDTDAWGTVGPPPTVHVTLSDDGSAVDPVRLHSLVNDPLATEVRTRMLRHLGLLPSTPYALDGPPWRIVPAAESATSTEPLDLTRLHLAATDLAVLASFAHTVEADDPGLLAFAGSLGATPAGTDAAAITAGLDDLARLVVDAVDGSAPDTTRRRLRALTAQLDETRTTLEVVRAARRAERERAVAALDAAADRERVLRAQLEAAEVEIERLTTDRAATAAAAISPADRRR